MIIKGVKVDLSYQNAVCLLSSSSLVSAVSAKCPICGNSWAFSLFVSTEHPRVQLAEGALLDVLRSMYSLSCKVVNFHLYSLHRLLHFWFWRVTTCFQPTPLLVGGPSLSTVISLLSSNKLLLFTSNSHLESAARHWTWLSGVFLVTCSRLLFS